MSLKMVRHWLLARPSTTPATYTGLPQLSKTFEHHASLSCLWLLARPSTTSATCTGLPYLSKTSEHHASMSCLQHSHTCLSCPLDSLQGLKPSGSVSVPSRDFRLAVSSLNMRQGWSILCKPYAKLLTQSGPSLGSQGADWQSTWQSNVHSAV